MKISNSRVGIYAVIDTDLGEFRVWPAGQIDMWNNETDVWGYFDEFKYSEGDVEALRNAAHDAITLELNKALK